MKKILIALTLLFSAAFCFAETVVIEDEKGDISVGRNPDGIVLSLGDIFYYSNRLESRYLPTWGFSGEAGHFKSDEDGLFDWVESDTFGLSFGKVDTDSLSFKNGYSTFTASNDASYGNFYFKNLFGPQLNVAIVSFAFLFGTKAGFDWMKVSTNKDFTYKERRIFADFVLEPYFSVNINRMFKIYASTEWDFSIVRVRFIKDSYYDDYSVKWNWFAGDVPTSYRVGGVFFF